MTSSAPTPSLRAMAFTPHMLTPQLPGAQGRHYQNSNRSGPYRKAAAAGGQYTIWCKGPTHAVVSHRRIMSCAYGSILLSVRCFYLSGTLSVSTLVPQTLSVVLRPVVLANLVIMSCLLSPLHTPPRCELSVAHSRCAGVSSNLSHPRSTPAMLWGPLGGVVVASLLLGILLWFVLKKSRDDQETHSTELSRKIFGKNGVQ